MVSANDEEFLTLKEAAVMLRVGQMTLWRWRRAGIIKDVYPFGRPEEDDFPRRTKRTVRIPKSEIIALLTAKKHTAMP